MEAPPPDQPGNQGVPTAGHDEIPVREVRDARVLRAIAHPVRLGILEELTKDGTLTATELAERLGESAANCSWHLRQLARYGFIEEAEGRTGRQRPWRLVVQSTMVSPAADLGSEFDRASDALLEVLLERALGDLRGWRAIRHREPSSWREASIAIATWDFLTSDELASFKRDLNELFARHFLAHSQRIDPARREPGVRPVRFVTWAFPADPPDDLDREPPGPATAASEST